MSGAKDAATSLRKALAQACSPVYTIGNALATAQKAALEATDVVDVMARAVEMIVAAGDLEAAAKAAKEAARDALATAIQDTGAPEVVTMHHKALMASKPAFASSDQPDMTPDEYMTKPQPDRERIRDALKRKIPVPGWSLRIPNDQSLRIIKRK